MKLTHITIGIIVGLIMGAVSISLNVFAQGPASAPLGSPIGEMLVVDSNGKVLGRVVNIINAASSEAVVALPFNRDWILIPVWRDQILPDSLSFVSSNCTGQAFLEGGVDSGGTISRMAVRGVFSPSDKQVYVENGPPQPIIVKSLMIPDEGCRVLNSPDFYSNYGFPAIPAIDLSGFTPPFSVIRR